MKDLTDEQIEHIAATEIPSWFTDSKIKRFARAIISVDRALNAPADLEHQSAGKPVAWLLTDKKINDIQVDSVQRLIDRARQAHFTDLIIRINGKDEHYQADWLKHLVRAEVPVCAPADRDVMRQVPEGWKLVPIEPTLDQYNSACRAYSDWQVQCQEEAREHEDERNPSWGYSQPHFTHSDVYRAMLAAVPTPPAEQQEEQEPIIYKRSEFTKNWTTFNVRSEHADAAEARLKGSNVLATLRAKVEALPVRLSPIFAPKVCGQIADEKYLRRDDVLAEIDKLGGGV